MELTDDLLRKVEICACSGEDFGARLTQMQIKIDHERAIKLIVEALKLGAHSGVVLPNGWAEERARNIVTVLLYDDGEEA